ncbi:long-chain-fatty-acid--CoA ligase [Bacteroidales bacterium]|nr:long-chain-fatty-acid--CoA ligase [Bacteroidales bacterium]
MNKENLIGIFARSFNKNWDLPALSNFGEDKIFFYKDLALEIEKLHMVFQQLNIKRGDKIALIGKNTSSWCISYLATISYGAIIVPILQDFNPQDVHHIVNHSDTSILFASDQIWESLDCKEIPNLKLAFSLSENRLLYKKEGESFNLTNQEVEARIKDKYPKGFSKEDIKYAETNKDDVVVISYTSGTTGFSKGVMLTGKNLAGNITFATDQNFVRKNDRLLSFLPLAHTFGCAFEFLTAISIGAFTTLLGKMPSPKILLAAFQEVRPDLIISVPLIFEKIYKNAVRPQLQKKTTIWALKIGFLRVLIYKKIRNKLMASLGGQLREVIIGGASLNGEVENFFHAIKFPLTIGYGMTECAPLISYAPSNKFIPSSCGRIVDNMQVRIDSKDPHNTAGEIQVKGAHVMKGYYKNQGATDDMFTHDGWLKTGDLGTIDKDMNIYIRGRSKSMILTSSGQNIYPEEIEAKLNNLPYMMESLVMYQNNKLIASVFPDYEALDKEGIDHSEIPAILEKNRKALNATTASYENLAEIQLNAIEFKKTPKRSIKRYLYTK